MGVPQLKGPFSLKNELDQLKSSLNVEGVYVLDRTTSGGNTKQYVGRTNSQTLYVRLTQHLNDEKYKRFWYAVATSLKDRFEGECELYHNYKNENDKHPERPKGKKHWECPYGCKF